MGRNSTSGQRRLPKEVTFEVRAATCLRVRRKDIKTLKTTF